MWILGRPVLVLDLNLPRIGITIGDAAGIGAEIVLKAIAELRSSNIYFPVIIGNLPFLQRTAQNLKLEIEFTEYSGTQSSAQQAVSVFSLDNLPENFEIGVDAAVTGKAAAEYIETAVDLWKKGSIDAIATAPISKRAIALGGYDFPGHTEFLAKLTDTERFAMSFFADKLRVVLLSTHVSLIDAIGLVKTEKLVDLIRFSHQTLSKLLMKDVRIAVAGLNPHASESGMFGNEERDEILPAIDYCRNELNIDASGPFSPDTIFLRAFGGEFDAVVACYHDQATIAVKCLSFGASVNVTLGLPLIRTSVDHGTAFDIAGGNIADHSSMVAAIKLASELAAN